jgi:drug/metabolite transporter (DMT)-like permease
MKSVMTKKKWLRQPGVLAALTAALLFGAGTPFAKLLLNDVNPWLLAGLLYIGSGIGLTIYRRLSKAPSVQLPCHEMLWFAGAIVAGGIVAPVLLMFGLTRTPASGASLLLNAEGVFTALLAWFAFKENFDRRIALGMVAIVAGAIVLSWQGTANLTGLWPSLALLGACFAWGIDNNLTRKVSLSDTTWIASIKGLVAGSVNLTLAFMLGASFPPWPNLVGAMVVGFFSYGVSLALFVVGLRRLGTARTGAYFSIAPFIGAVIALGFGEPLTLPLMLAGALMALGIWLHLTEHHEHEHTHTAIEHEHEHTHDEHHQHIHDATVIYSVSHIHRHRHAMLTHVHEHFPDAHHQHKH